MISKARGKRPMMSNMAYIIIMVLLGLTDCSRYLTRLSKHLAWLVDRPERRSSLSLYASFIVDVPIVLLVCHSQHLIYYVWTGLGYMAAKFLYVNRDNYAGARRLGDFVIWRSQEWYTVDMYICEVMSLQECSWLWRRSWHPMDLHWGTRL